jgi:hypothetical protein
MRFIQEGCKMPDKQKTLCVNDLKEISVEELEQKLEAVRRQRR